MSFSRSLSAAEQHTLISTANAAVVRIVSLFTAKLGNKHFFSREDIEDIAGDVIMKAWRSMDGYDPERAKMSTWVGRIAVNCVKDAVDYKMKRLPISGAMYVTVKEDGEEFGADELVFAPEVLNAMSENSADARAIHSELQGRICEEVSRMSDKRQRVAYMMNAGYKPKEIAAAEGSKPQAVSKCIWDIREALRTALAEWAEESNRRAC